MAGIEGNMCCCCISYAVATRINTFLLAVEAGIIGYVGFLGSKRGEMISIIAWINFLAMFVSIILHIRAFKKKTRGAREIAANSILIANMLFVMLMGICFAWIFIDFKSAFPSIIE